jgi:hypothetical protein
VFGPAKAGPAYETRCEANTLTCAREEHIKEEAVIKKEKEKEEAVDWRHISAINMTL